jgi:hypothetical protein
MKRGTQKPAFGSLGVIIGAVVVGLGLFLSLVGLVNFSRPDRAPVGLVTVALTVVPLPSPTPTATAVPDDLLPEDESLPSPPPGELAIGAFVKVSGTEGAGLRLRIKPGLDFEPVYLGMEDEIFKIEAGPEQANDYTWWYLVAPFDPDRNGWAVSNYLEAVSEP